MESSLFGNKTAALILLYIANYSEGHISGIAKTFDVPKNQVRVQMIRLENGGIIVGRNIGNLRMFTINPRCLYKGELAVLLERILETLPEKVIERYFRQRRRPRRTGKQL
jgi:hypothetical protein